jgi:glycosyltransferase involved in cell wall biosynthesis
MRIVRLITRLNIGGPALQVIFLNREMQNRGYETLLLTGECEPDEGQVDYLLKASDPVRRIAFLGRSVSPFKNLRALWRVWRILRDVRPDVVHTHTAMAGCVGRAAAIIAGVPVIVHTYHGNSLRHYFSRISSAVFRNIERALAARTDVLCALCPQQVRELSEEMRVAGQEKFRVVPLGLDLTSYLDLPLPRAGETIRVGWFGRLVDVKNIRLFLETVEATQDGTKRFEFHIAGDGPDRKYVESAVRRFGSRLIWHGWKQDITPVLAECDLVLQTSKNEGTPAALIQAMAAGRAFVSTPAGGVVDMTCGQPEALTPEDSWYDNAVLVPPNPQAFARVLGEFAQSPQRIRTMGQTARTFAAARYREEVLAANLDQIYRECLKRKLPHAANALNPALEPGRKP